MTTNNNTTSPLLASDHLLQSTTPKLPPPMSPQRQSSADARRFNNEISSQVKLQVPNEWKSESTRCHLELDTATQLLRVISDDLPGKVLDVIDPQDLIGARLQLEPQHDDNDNPDTTPLVPGRASNEPPTNILANRQGVAVLTLYCYPKLNPSSQTWFNWCGLTSYRPRPNPKYDKETTAQQKWPRYAHPRHFVLEPSETLHEANHLLTSLQTLAGTLTAQRYLVIVNPFSGPKRNGQERCETLVQPMLEEAGLEVDVLVTTHAGHARERMARCDNQDISQYHGLVILGGDGILFEILNGIMERDDHEAIRNSLKLGIVGCGTSNGFAASVAHASDEHYGPITETYLIAKGGSVWSDVSKYETANGASSYISFLTYTYAMIADIDIESEVARWMGETRNDVWAVLRLLFLRKYPAKLSYLPADKVPDKTTTPISNMPALSEPIPKDTDWVTIDDDIVLLWVSQVTHAAMHTHQAPDAQFQDGVFQIMLVRGNPSRFRLARILLGLETATHVGQPQCEIFEACAFRLEPSPGQVGRNVVDGELVESGPIQGHVLPRMFQFFCQPKNTPS